MMPARARSAALMSPLPFAWPLPFEWPLVWPFEVDDFFACGFVDTEPPAEPGADLPLGFVPGFSATGGRGFFSFVCPCPPYPASCILGGEPPADPLSRVLAGAVCFFAEPGADESS